MTKKNPMLTNWAKVSYFILAKWTQLSTLTKVLVPFIGLFTFGYFLYDRYVTGKIVVEFNEDSAIALQSFGITGFKKDEGALSIFILDFNVKNLTNRTKTIKSVKLEYELNGNKYIKDSFVLMTGEDSSSKNGLVFRNSAGKPKIALLEWKNLRTEIYKYQPLAPEGILNGSTVFLLLNCRMSDYKNLKNVKFLITDSKNKVYKQKFELKDKYSQIAYQGYFYSQYNERLY